MHTIAIEQINLNGTPVTTENGTLFVNGQAVVSDTYVIDEHMFAKGYVPISFFSSLPISGTKLTEVFFGSRFIATGYMVHCTYPDMANGDVAGRFYYRFPENVAQTYDIADFSMSQGHITQKSAIPFNANIPSDALIGIDVTNFPSKIRNLSINLLGFFPGAGAFDRVPKDYSFYLSNVSTGENILEQFAQYNTTLTGLNVYCSSSGSGYGYTSGQIYKRDKSGTKSHCNDFSLESGYMYSPDQVVNINLSGSDRIGIDITSALSGINGLMISAHGYLN